MGKYLTVFTVSLQNEFTYRLNFILWRFRNVLRFLMTYFLWNVVYTGQALAFGYERSQMMGYVFLVLVVTTVIISMPSNDNVGGEIASGDLSNYLVKPMHYLKFWFTRDLASKLLNISFSVVELFLLILIFRPQIALSPSPGYIFLGIVAMLIGMMVYFLLTKLAIFVAFWIPEQTWGLMFVVNVLMEIVAGAIFPLDVLPGGIQRILDYTPFPYLIYYPIKIMVGRFTLIQTLSILTRTLVWLIIGSYLTTRVWRHGLKAYSASGR